MTSSQLHARADRLALSRGVSHSEALAILARNGAAKRRRKDHGRTTISEADRAATIKAHGAEPKYWWNDL